MIETRAIDNAYGDDDHQSLVIGLKRSQSEENVMLSDANSLSSRKVIL